MGDAEQLVKFYDDGYTQAPADAALYAAKQHGRNAVWIARAEQEADGEPRPSSAVRADAGT